MKKEECMIAKNLASEQIDRVLKFLNEHDTTFRADELHQWEHSLIKGVDHFTYDGIEYFFGLTIEDCLHDIYGGVTHKRAADNYRIAAGIIDKLDKEFNENLPRLLNGAEPQLNTAETTQAL